MINPVNLPASYKNATGKIAFSLTNDYLFRAVFQKSRIALKGLICSVLHLAPEDVKSVEITNPIELGRQYDDKTFVLDINVVLNNDSLINLEMQMENQHNWQDRSLSYLCRSFDQLYQGQEYTDAKPVTHIGFLNFAPFPDHPEFNAVYRLLNIKNHNVYSDKFTLNVIDLKHTELATAEDKAFQIDYWARLFTATSWEELKMIADNNIYMEAATQTMYELSADELVQQQCRARRDYYKQINTYNRSLEQIKELEKKTSLLESQNASLENENALLRKRIAELESQ